MTVLAGASWVIPCNVITRRFRGLAPAGRIGGFSRRVVSPGVLRPESGFAGTPGKRGSDAPWTPPKRSFTTAGAIRIDRVLARGLSSEPSTFNLEPSTLNLQPSTFNLQSSYPYSTVSGLMVGVGIMAVPCVRVGVARSMRTGIMSPGAISSASK